VTLIVGVFYLVVNAWRKAASSSIAQRLGLGYNVLLVIVLTVLFFAMLWALSAAYRLNVMWVVLVGVFIAPYFWASRISDWGALQQSWPVLLTANADSAAHRRLESRMGARRGAATRCTCPRQPDATPTLRRLLLLRRLMLFKLRCLLR
jgi:hypothetical protein